MQAALPRARHLTIRTTPVGGVHFAHPAKNVAALSIAPGMVIADFGAGSGHYTLEFARQQGGTGRVYAIDVQQDLLRRIKNEATARGLKDVEIVHGDVSRLHGSKLADNSVDLVLVSNLLFQLEEPLEALREAKRVIGKGGAVAVIDWSDAAPGGGQRFGPTKKHVVGKERALALAHNADLELVREFEAGAHHYGLLLRTIPSSRA